MDSGPASSLCILLRIFVRTAEVDLCVVDSPGARAQHTMNGLNPDRFLELVPFVLGHFCDGPDARRLNNLLEASRRLQLQQQHQGGVGSMAAAAGGGGGLGGVLPQTLMRLDRPYTVVHVDRPLHEKVRKVKAHATWRLTAGNRPMG